MTDSAATPSRAGAHILEQGDIFFFYRPRVGAEEVRGRGDVQRFYMVLAPERPRRVYRLFVVGSKRLPEMERGARHPRGRNWALNVLTSKNPQDIRRGLGAVEYASETRGERVVGAATPVGEGKYQLLKYKRHTELAYALELPKEPGPAQEEFEIKEEAGYVVAVKNPEVATPGAPSAHAPPAYPKHLRGKFGARRWIDVEEPALLDYENTQILLLAAHAEDVEEELGVRIDTEDKKLSTAEVCRELRLHCERERVKPLLTGDFPSMVDVPPAETGDGGERAGGEEVRRLPPSTSPSKAGKRGGAAAAKRAPSAAAITKLLAGIDFPKNRAGIVAYARQHGDRIDNPEEAIAVLSHLPDRRYEKMADVAAGLGRVR
ncbi:DUF2795 domain-containing protein [Sorangium sp. So ce128]|uniref:DUF2795 domain-containing protein n=1 Tax=Sorangium sp. So ce128 TaxID=3133281 RepID=UPI003F618C09